MRLPNWLRICWWVLLLSVTSILLYHRYDALTQGNATVADVILFVVWIAVFLAPLFQEVTILGVKFKQEIESLKSHVDIQIRSLQSEIRTSVDVRNMFSPSLTLQPTLSEEQLRQISEQVRDRIPRAEEKSDPESRFKLAGDEPIPNETIVRIRYVLEQELKRLYALHFDAEVNRRRPSVAQMIRALQEKEIIDSNLAVAARELYSIASMVIHGEDVRSIQLKFAYDVNGWLIRELRSLGYGGSSTMP